MVSEAHKVLAKVTTVGDMVAAFTDEERCRRLLEAMVCRKAGFVPRADAGSRRRLPDATLAVVPVPACTNARTANVGSSSL